MPSFRRLEIWSDVQCHAGTRLAVLPDGLAIAPVYDLGGDEQCTVTLPVSSPAYSAFVEKRVLRIVTRTAAGAELVEEWRIADREDNTGQSRPVATVTARTLLLDLGEVIAAFVLADGSTDYTISFVDLTLAEAIDAVILPALAARGRPWFTRGTIDATARFSYEGEGQTVLSLLRAWAELFNGLELRLVRNGSTSYHIELRQEIGAGAVMPRVETRKNLVSTTRTRSTAEQATRAIPRGVDVGARRASVEEVRWLVSAVDAGTKRLTLADELGVVQPIWFDDQLNGWLAFRDATGRTFPIVDTLFATQQIELADVSTFAVGERIFLRVSDPGTNNLNWRPLLGAGYSFTNAAPLYYVSAVNGGTLRATIKDSMGGAGGQIVADGQMVDWMAVFCTLVLQSVGGVISVNAAGSYYQCGAISLSAVQVGDIVFVDQSTSTAPPFTSSTNFPYFAIGTVTAVDNTTKRITVQNRYSPAATMFAIDRTQTFSLRVYRASTSLLIRHSYNATDELEFTSVAGVAVGQLVEVRQTCGGVLPSYLDAPASVASYGVIEKFIDRTTMRGETELVPNPFMRIWTGASTVPPDGWSLQAGFVGTPEVTKETTPGYWNYGGQSARVRLARFLAPPYVNNGASFVSPPFRVWRSGSYRTTITFKMRILFAALSADASLIVKLESTSPNRAVGPLGTNGVPKPLRTLYAMTHSDASIPDTDRFDVNTWYEITVTAFDVSNATMSSPLQLVFLDGNTGGELEFVLDAVQVTQTDYDPGVFIEAAESVTLWQEAARYLTDFAEPAIEYAIQFRDLARLDGSAWEPDAITLGGRMVIRDTQLGITSTSRVVRFAPNLLDPLSSTVLLSSRQKWLTRMLATLVNGTTAPSVPVGSVSLSKLIGGPPGTVPVSPPGGGPPVWQPPPAPGGGTGSYLTFDPDAPFTTPSALDDEFSVATLDPKWIQVNTGLTGVALDTVTAPGLLRVVKTTNSTPRVCLMQAIPAGDFTAFLKMDHTDTVGDFWSAGFFLADGVTAGAGNQYNIGNGHSSGRILGVFRETNYTTFSTTIFSTGQGLHAPYLRLSRSGTALTLDVSYTGLSWISAVTWTSIFGLTHIGIGYQHQRASTIDEFFADYFRVVVGTPFARLGARRVVVTVP